MTADHAAAYQRAATPSPAAQKPETRSDQADRLADRWQDTSPARRLQWLLFAAYSLLLIAYLFVGRHWTDEGWYLNASLLVAQGKLPYLDFAFTQSPGLPYLNAVPQVIFGPSLWVGRLTSLVFALGTGWLTLYAARRLGGEWGAVWAFGFFALNLYTLHFLTVILTYPAATFFLAAALACLVAPWPAPWRVGAALVLAGLAVGVRFSALVAFLAILGYGLWLLRRRPSQWVAVLPGLAVLGAILGPFWLADPVATRFNIVGYHVDQASWPEIVWRSRYYWVNFVPGYLSWTLLGPILVGIAWWRGWRPVRSIRQAPVLWLLAVTVVLTTLLHALPENPQAKYQTLVAPWAAVLVGVGLTRLARWQGWSWLARPRLALLLVSVPLLLQIGGNLALWVARGELSPRFSEIDVADGRLPLAEIEELGAFVRERTPPDEPIATLFTSIAVAAHRPVLPGLEMSIFALRVDSPELAGRLRLMTPAQLRSAIEEGRPSAVVVESILAGAVPSASLAAHYCPAHETDQIGQFREPVTIYLRRSDGHCP